MTDDTLKQASAAVALVEKMTKRAIAMLAQRGPDYCDHISDGLRITSIDGGQATLKVWQSGEDWDGGSTCWSDERQIQTAPLLMDDDEFAAWLAEKQRTEERRWEQAQEEWRTRMAAEEMAEYFRLRAKFEGGVAIVKSPPPPPPPPEIPMQERGLTWCAYTPKEGDIACFGKMLYQDVVAGQAIELLVWGQKTTVEIQEAGYLVGISGYSTVDAIHLVPVYGTRATSEDDGQAASSV